MGDFIKNKSKILFFIIIFLISITGCSKEVEYTSFQNAYFEISDKAKKNEIFDKSILESIIGEKVTEFKKSEKKDDFNSYIFEENDEDITIALDSDGKLKFIKYEKAEEIILVNNLEPGSNIGGYYEGFTSRYKVKNLESQKEQLKNTLKN